MFADKSLPRNEFEEILQLFTDCVMDYAVFTVDGTGAVTTWNRGAERLFGYSAEEIKGRSCELFYPAESRLRGDLAYELEVARKRGSYESECQRVRKDGNLFGAYLVITPLRQEAGSSPGFAVITRDVTEQRRTAQEILDQRRRLRSILETAVDAVVIIDEQGIVDSINPAGVRLFGYQADEVIGQNVNMLMPEPYAAEHTSYIQRYLRTGDAKIIGIGREVQARRKDGSLFPADLAVSTFYDGRPLFTGILRDISERKAMEAEVLQIAESEQRRIGQELHDDAQQQLSALTMIARHAADSLAGLLPRIPELMEVHAKVERVTKGLRDANQSLREVARGLVPLQVEAHGLRDALVKLAEQIQELHEADCRCEVDEGA
ncbi:MAG: PAS domain S-box protein [Planctomycetaceae bacterium]